MITVIICGLISLFILLKSLTVIPARKVAIEERLGSFRRVLSPGLWFVMWPLSYVRDYRWTYYNQDNKLVSIRDKLVSMDKCQMDIPPIKCVSKDKLQVCVDATLTYIVSDPKKAVYDVDDALNLFYQRVAQCIHVTTAKYDADEIVAMLGHISEDILESVNADKSPIYLAQVLLQKVEMDNDLVHNNTMVYKQSTEQKNKIAILEGQKAARKLERDFELEEMEHERVKLQFEIDNRMTKAEAKAKERAIKWQGFDNDQRIEMKRVKALKCINESAEKVVYAPVPFWQKSIKSIKLTN